MRRQSLLLAALVAVATTPLAAGTDATALKRLMVDDLTSMKSLFDQGYAPKKWKEHHLEWDLEAEYEIAKWRINALENPKLKQYQSILKDFIHSTRDYHVQIAFWATETARLPFNVAEAEGRYFISHIERYKLSDESFPFEVGDELVSFDGKPVAEAIEEVRQLAGWHNVAATDRSLAAIALTERPATLFPSEGAVPRGPVAVGIRPKGSNEIKWRQLAWHYTPEEISQDTPRVRNINKKFWERIRHTGAGAFHEPLMVHPLWAQHQADGRQPMGDEYEPIGHRKTLLPFLGEVIWEYSPSFPEGLEDGRMVKIPWQLNFNAYIYQTPSGKKVGFVRIPHYDAEALEARIFGDIMKHMEAEADALIIDQMNNPGGSVFYVYALLSHLSDQPLKTPRHVMTITQEKVLEAKEMLPVLLQIHDDVDAKELLGSDELFSGYPVDYTLVQMMVEYCRFIIEEWNSGRWKTRPYYIFAIDQINPARSGVFTKPIIMLVNELDFSGADFFPAILQDNDRVTLVGTRTAGAGGYVLGHMYPNIFGVQGVAYTASLAWRPSMKPIENLGVQPDFILERTARDMEYGYEDYAQSLNAIVEQVLAK